MTAFGALRRLPDERLIYYDTQVPLANSNVSLIEDAGGRIWMTRPDGLYIIKPEPLAALAQFPAFTVRNSGAEALTQEAGQEGRTPLPEKDGEVFKYRKFEGKFSAELKFLYRTSDGHVWITTTQDLIEFDGQSFHLYSAAQGIPTEPTRMMEDLNGNLWVGGQSGALRLDRRGMTTYDLTAAQGQARVRSIYEDERGRIFAFIGQGLVARFDGKDFRTVQLHIAPDDKFLWTSNGGFLDSKGQWWVLTNKRLYRFAAASEPGDLSQLLPAAVYDKRDGLPADTMYCLFEDRSGGIWVSTRDDNARKKGLAKWLPSENRFHVFSEAEGFSLNKAAASFAEDAAGNLWLGFYEGGLARYSQGRFTEFTSAEGLPGGLITALHLDKQGRLWVASSVGGLSRLDDTTTAQPRFISYTTAAEELGVSFNTIKFHMRNIYDKLQVHSKSEAVAKALRNRLIN